MEEHWQALEVFLACSGQWRFIPLGMAGVMAQGLDYPSLLAVMDMHNINQNERKEVLAQIRLIESGALSEMNKTKS